MSKVDQDKDETKNALEKLVSLGSIASIVASLIVILTSTLKSYMYSNYFGIALNNFSYFSTVVDMVISIFPCVLFILAIQAFNLCCIDDVTGFIEDKEYIWAFLYAIICIAFFELALYVLMVNEKYILIKNYTLAITITLIVSSLILLILFLVEIFKTRSLKSSKDSKKLESKLIERRGTVKERIWVVGAFIAVYYLLSSVIGGCNPEFIHDVEITTINGYSYAIICDSNGNKIAMECNVNEDNNTLDIYSGEYIFIDPENYSFEKKTFNYIYCVERPIYLTE